MGTPADSLGYLGQLTTSPEAQQDARQILSGVMSNSDQAADQQLLGEVSDNAEQAKAALRSARDRLMSLSISPRQQSLDEAAAWLSPTRTGNFADSLSNVARAKANDYARNQEMQMLGAEQGVDLQKELSGIDQNTLNAKMRLQEIQDQRNATLGRTALDVLGRSTKPLAPHPLELKSIPTPGGGSQEVNYDPATGHFTPIGKPISDIPPINPTIVDMLGTGQMQWPSSWAMGNPKTNWQSTIAAVHQKYPWAGGQTYPMIQKTMESFATGPEGQKLATIDRALQHVDVLEKAHTALQNGDIKGLNYLGNELGLQLGSKQQSAAATYDAIKSTVAAELAQAVVQRSGVSERGERAEHLQRDYTNQTTEQIVQAYKDLMKGQLQGLHQQFLAGMMPGPQYASSPAYKDWQHQVDQRFNAHLTDRGREIWTPAPAASLQYLKDHPESASIFKQHYGYLPGSED